jgi:hypothetical protein
MVRYICQGGASNRIVNEQFMHVSKPMLDGTANDASSDDADSHARRRPNLPLSACPMKKSLISARRAVTENEYLGHTKTGCIEESLMRRGLVWAVMRTVC